MTEIIDLSLLIKLDINKYVQWVLTHKSVDKAEKKDMVRHLLEGTENSITNYRTAIDEVFYKTKYWKSPTVQDIENFPYWRASAFKVEVKFYEGVIDGNPFPLSYIKDKEFERLSTLLNHQMYSDTLLGIYNTWLSKDFYHLGVVAGKIDYLKWLDQTAKEDTEALTPSVQDSIEIKHCLLFLYGDKKILNKSAHTKRLSRSGFTQDYAEKAYAQFEEYLNDKNSTSRTAKNWNKKIEDLKDPIFRGKVKARLYPS